MSTTKLCSKNRQAHDEQEAKRMGKNTLQHLGHFASKKVLKEGHNTDPMPKPTPGPEKKRGVVDTVLRGMGFGKTKTEPAKEPARATPQPASEPQGIYSGNKTAREMENEVAR